MRNILSVLILCLWVPYALAANYAPYNILQPVDEIAAFNGDILLLEQPLLFAENTRDQESETESGTLVIPGDDKDKADKKCLTVCKKWGEDCIINPRTGARNCRRTCKDFGEECF
jgi:hypothetical protein